MAAVSWSGEDEWDAWEDWDRSGEGDGFEEPVAPVVVLARARPSGGSSPRPVVLEDLRAARRRTFRRRRLLALMLVAVVGAVVWSAFDRLLVAAGGAPVGASACTAGPSRVQEVSLASAGAAVHPSSRLVASGASYCDQVYVTRPGDTIWGIAVRYSGTGDPRPLMDSLEAQISGRVLQPGQRLAVP